MNKRRLREALARERAHNELLFFKLCESEAVRLGDPEQAAALWREYEANGRVAGFRYKEQP